jgi:fatty-acyl-CoA synthase
MAAAPQYLVTGKPIPLMMDIAIIDPKTGKKVAEGERGEVCLKSAAIMKCYHNNPEKTAEAIDKEGCAERHSYDTGPLFEFCGVNAG